MDTEKSEASVAADLVERAAEAALPAPTAGDITGPSSPGAVMGGYLPDDRPQRHRRGRILLPLEFLLPAAASIEFGGGGGPGLDPAAFLSPSV